MHPIILEFESILLHRFQLPLDRFPLKNIFLGQTIVLSLVLACTTNRFKTKELFVIPENFVFLSGYGL